MCRQKGHPQRAAATRSPRREAARPSPRGFRDAIVPTSGGEGGIRTRDRLPCTAFPVRRPRPLGDLSTGQSTGTLSDEPRLAHRGPRRSSATPLARGLLAERAGFEPAVLSHTAFRERHHQPLGHLSTGEDNPRRRSGSMAHSAGGRLAADSERRDQVRGLGLHDPGHDPDAATQSVRS